MNRLSLALMMAVASCAGCSTPWTSPGPTSSPGSSTPSSGMPGLPSLPGKPRHCLAYPDPAVCRALQCDANFTAGCPTECVDPDGDGGAPPTCSATAQCQHEKI